MVEMIVTTKYQHSLKCKDGKRRNYCLFFLNGVQIYKQRVPFDENMELGFQGKYHYTNEYIFN